MTLAIVYSRASSGISAPLITVEVHISRGAPLLNIVGLPEAAVKESKDRVRSALMNSGFEFPRSRITINLAPADLPKGGGRFDLPIALGILAASRQISKKKLSENEFTGELALSGDLRWSHGVLPMVISVKQAGRNLIIPASNAVEASVVKDAKVFTANHLLEVCAYLRGERDLPACQYVVSMQEDEKLLDLADVKGQSHAKQALEIVAAGKHSGLFIGPPGTGKTMLASRLPGISPSLSEEQALEVAAISSISSSGFNPARWQKIPFRSPHHSSSSVALVGGGRPPRPGEISLAHQGILFLDELPEFSRQVLESLREPLESGQITISRSAFQMIYPAQFQLIAAMNPCPCGYAGSASSQCHCTHEQVQRYMRKLSGPLLDRIDLHVEVPTLSPEVLAKIENDNVDKSCLVKERVIQAQHIQRQRQGKCNAHLSVTEIQTYCQLDDGSQQLLLRIMQKFNLSARIYHRILKVARTIADLAGDEMILGRHLSAALTYRCLDRAKVIQ